MKRFTLYLLIMVLLGTPVGAWCQEQGQAAPEGAGDITSQTQEVVQQEDISGSEAEDTLDESEEPPPIHYEMEPETDTWLGGRLVDLIGSSRAMEYGRPASSLAGGFKLHYSPLPHRIDTELDWHNNSDYKAEFAYAYQDIVKLNYTGLALWHNLDHHVLTPTTGLVTNDYSPNDIYHVTTRDNRVFLRLKWPERAYHVFADFRQFEKEGTIQQRFYTSTGSSSKASRSRDIDWITRRYTMGMNGHFGPVEIEYSHLIKTFDPHKVVFTRETVGTVVERGFVPTFETNSDTIKVHTDLTGRIVAAATFITGEKTNHHSRSEIDFNRGYADLTFIPFEHLTVAVRYRYRELQEKVPLHFGVQGSDGVTPGDTVDPIDSRTNEASITTRYSPMNEFSVKAEYRFQKVERRNANLWNDEGAVPLGGIPFDQNIHTAKVGVNTRPLKTLSFKGSLEYMYTSEPAYPTKPENSYNGKFDANWIPVSSVDLDAYYRFFGGENDTAHMNMRTDSIGWLLTWVPVERLSVYANYDYTRLKNEMDLVFVSSTAGNFLPVDHVPYRDASHLYALGAGYAFSFPLNIGAEFHQSWSRGMFRTNVSDPLNIPVTTANIGGLTDLSIRETGCRVNARYDFPKGWGASLNYSVNNYEDLKKQPQDGDQDGTAHTVLVMVSRKW